MAYVECRYCRAVNGAEERRCERCGRRLHLAAARPAPDLYPLKMAGAAALAPALADLPDPETREAASQGWDLPAAGEAGRRETARRGAGRDEGLPSEPAARREPVYQPSLFREGLGSPKVIPIPTLTPLRSREKSPVRRVPARPSAPRSRRSAASQQALEFHEAPEGPLGGRLIDSTLQPALQVELIYCDAPVASPAHRAVAAAVDLSMVLIGIGLFLGVFCLSGGEVALNRHTVPLLLGLGAVIALFYRFLWCIANGDTPGMRFAGLRLVDFDGRKPDREKRGLRQIAGVLSFLSAGLGLVWAFVDEEKLAWHDHISKTFPTIS
jgi:uncharacterized RDD family membrane protein YckC